MLTNINEARFWQSCFQTYRAQQPAPSQRVSWLAHPVIPRTCSTSLTLELSGSNVAAAEAAIHLLTSLRVVPLPW